jgi:RHS repeat-associated protein
VCEAFIRQTLDFDSGVAMEFRGFFLVMLVLACAILPGGCTCAGAPPLPPRALIACIPQHAIHPTTAKARAADAVETVAAGGAPGSFSITSTGEASFVMPLVTPPGRAGIEPQIALTYSSSGGDGVLGRGFSITGSSAITRCPKNLTQDGEIRGVRYDAGDKLCLDGKPLVEVGNAPGRIEYRTVPDTFVKVLGRDPDEDGTPRSFEVLTTKGLLIEYGTSEGTRPRGPGGAPRAWLAARARDARGNAMTYGYCFASAGEHTAEVALDEVRYTSFEGSPALPASRAVKLVYGTKDPEDIRTLYAGGVALQSSLRLEKVEMVGPGEELVRHYAFSYELSPTSRTLLTAVEECAGDGVCKPATRFQYQSREPGFKERETSIATPTARAASPLLSDIDGDGLDDLVIPDTDKAQSTPQNPITRWLIAHNGGASASPAYLESAALGFSQEWVSAADPSGPADPTLLQPELGSVLDYDGDGRRDLLLHDVHDALPTWQVLLAQPDRTFKLHETGIRRPFPLSVAPTPPTLTSRGGSMHLLDADGDHVPDLVQCEDHGATADGNPSKAVWRVHLWKPAQGGDAAGWDPEGETIDALAENRCDAEFHTTDLNADGKVDIVLKSFLVFSDGTEIPAANYYALTRLEDGSWEAWDTKLPVVSPGGRVVFMDTNGDRLPDAVESGFQDHALRTYINTGSTFAEMPVTSLGDAGLGNQDTFFRLAAVLDWNGDGRADLLMPIPAGTPPNTSNVLPAWAILQAKAGDQGEATFTLVDSHIPFEAELEDAITLADPHGPRLGDLNGDGAPDVVLPLGGVFRVFENVAPDQDVLVAIADGMNAHDPEDDGFVPNVSISYGHLTDPSITNGLAEDDPAMESALYLSRSDPANDCIYPRRCAVGARRVVSGYELNDGTDGVRRFEVRYRDGRYHQLGLGFLGFGERILIDRDTRAGSADFYDNRFFDEDLKAFPLSGQVERQWRWAPGLSSQPKPEQIDLSFLDIARTVVPTSSKSYFTLAVQARLRRVEGSYSPGGPTLEAFVRKVEASGGAKVLRDTTAKVTDFDAFGNVLAEEIATAGVDLTLNIDRTFKNDTTRWALGQLQTQKECSSEAKISQCRTLTRTTTIYGEVETEAVETDDGSPETKLHVTYVRDDFGNITAITADDAFEHHRSSTITYEPEGIFPFKHVNAAGHTSFTEFDAGLGALTKWTDPNGLVTEWRYDAFGRLGLEKRPDGSHTTFTLSRAKDGGPDKNAWRVTQRTTTSGGADDEVEYDSLGRPLRWWWHGPTPPRSSGEPPRLMQEVAYDPLNGQVARRSVPVSEGTAEGKILFDEYAFDALGREVRHTTPWNATTKTAYDGLLVEVTDALGNVTITKLDPLGRPVAITDAAKGVTSYLYGPFGWLYSVTDPGTPADPSGAVTTTTRDALGRVKKLDDPDRGTAIHVYDGFGELLSTTDALGRVATFEYDALGRTKSRTDQQKGAPLLTTTWTWDTAPNGIGKLHKVASPDGEKTYAYSSRGQPEGLTLAVSGAGAILEGKLGYDELGRVETITYPTPAGAPPFIVTKDYDPFGHVLKVHDGVTEYWRLTDVDNAGRFRTEVLGNGVSTERSYFPGKPRLKSIVTDLVTESGTTPVQELAYEFDARLNLTSRTDALQVKHKTERFRYDRLERLTCAYFSVQENPFAPCASSYDYAPNGNLTFKSDVGVLSYGDPAHPHAVTSAGGGSFGYNAVGNQVTRPGGVTVSYTPFDLPRQVKQGASAVTFGYDGDEQRIRKTTPDEETLYFGDLYERVTQVASAKTEHRFYIHSPERVVAVVTRGGDKPGALFVHVDHLGSVDVLTDEDGGVVERRSYDAFGQRRNPVWGQAPPASFSSKTTKGFTGHEGDDELGLVNMRGRVYDPKLGRFLTTDPIISNLYFGQSLNAFSYVLNNPLRFVDPSGFEPEPPPILPIHAEVSKDANGEIRVDLRYPPYSSKQAPAPPAEGKKEDAAKVGAATPTTDVDTTGSSTESDAEDPDERSPGDWARLPLVQVEGGFLGGLALGLVPFGSVIASAISDPGTKWAEIGKGVGEIFGGGFAFTAGVAGFIGGSAASGTGVLTLPGVAAVVGSAALVAGGIANVKSGAERLGQALSMSSGSGSSGPQGASPAAGGGAKRGPKTDPTSPHNAAIRAEAEALEAEGNRIIAGGGRAKERLIATQGGAKGGRRPDIIYKTPSGELRGRNVGLVDSKGQPIPREQSALDDLNGPGGLPTDFVPYTK